MAQLSQQPHLQNIGQRPWRRRPLVAVSVGLALTMGSGAVAIAQAPPPASLSLSLASSLSRPTLRPGSEDEAVSELQAMLILLGFYGGPVTGTYDDATEMAVQTFQAAAGVAADGIVGPATWGQLLPTPAGLAQAGAGGDAANTPGASPSGNTAAPSPSQNDADATELPVLKLGDEGAAVVRLQQKLAALGVYNGPIDGLFGEQTEEAVAAAQDSRGLTVDGVVGPATWRSLLQ